MKVLCPSCERLVELVDLRVERGGLVARCPACGAEQRQQLPARPVTVLSPKAAKASGTTDAPRPAPAPADEDENDEGPTIILLTPTSDAVPLAVAPPGTSALPKPAEVARFDSPTRPPAIAPVTVEPASPPKRVVDAEFAQLLNQLGDVHPPTPPPQALHPRNTGSTPVVAPQPGVARGSTIQIPPGHCPKCITPRTREALICPACGLVFANFRAEEHQPSAALESAWRGLEERWTRQDEHEKFLQLAFSMDELAKAGRLYRIRLAATPDDPQTKVALESMVRMASTAAAAAAKTDPAELQRNRRKVLAVSAMLFFVIPVAALLVNFLLRAH
ncbi:MAG TPA: hypothetical protein VLT82_12510 [Myxococcaceae bacterium]|nr:hypothetical protein [Myxococcaceae bacterium]